jgi:hypothetical protein
MVVAMRSACAVSVEQVPQGTITNCINSKLLNEINTTIDQRIKGRSETNALPLFTAFYSNAVKGVFTKNPDCWAGEMDFSSCSVWNSSDKSHPTGTLITPKHVLSATHYPVSAGLRLTFVSKAGKQIVRKVVKTKQIPFIRKDYPDLIVGLLDDEIPPEDVTPATILPLDYKQMLGKGEGLPCIWLSQHKEVKIGDVALLDGVSVVTFPPKDPERKRFYKRIAYYDSGSPVYMIINGQTVLLTVWTRGSDHGVGTSVADFAKKLDGVIEVLSPGAKYTLERINLKD